jgi:hypothetical protein
MYAWWLSPMYNIGNDIMTGIDEPSLAMREPVSKDERATQTRTVRHGDGRSMPVL